MKTPARYGAWLLPLFVAGCIHVPFHKNQTAKSTILAPSLQTQNSQPLELVSVQLPPGAQLIPGKPIYNMREHPEPIHQPEKHRKPLPPEEVIPAQETAATPAPAVRAIGDLSSGDPTSSRQQTQESIAAIEHGLNGISRNLSDSDQKTASNIREDIKQAKVALASGDVDGAQNLVGKAKVLLDELTK
jgi:hypothetical protein